jgi:hypothetical protein
MMQSFRLPGSVLFVRDIKLQRKRRCAPRCLLLRNYLFIPDHLCHSSHVLLTAIVAHPSQPVSVCLFATSTHPSQIILCKMGKMCTGLRTRCLSPSGSMLKMSQRKACSYPSTCS